MSEPTVGDLAEYLKAQNGAKVRVDEFEMWFAGEFVGTEEEFRGEDDE